MMREALREYNIDIVPFPNFRSIPGQQPGIWEYIDKPIQRPNVSGSALDDLVNDNTPLLGFPVRYQLEVCISHGYLNEHNLTPAFVKKLLGMNASEAQDLLEYVANNQKRIHDSMTIFDLRIVRNSKSRNKIPRYCVQIRSATVTPTTLYFNTPSVEISNRVIRQYAQDADRFLRVRFADEKSIVRHPSCFLTRGLFATGEDLSNAQRHFQ